MAWRCVHIPGNPPPSEGCKGELEHPKIYQLGYPCGCTASIGESPFISQGNLQKPHWLRELLFFTHLWINLCCLCRNDPGMGGRGNSVVFFQLENRSSAHGYGMGLFYTTALESSVSAPRKSPDRCRQTWSSGDSWNVPGRIQPAKNPSSSADPSVLKKGQQIPGLRILLNLKAKQTPPPGNLDKEQGSRNSWEHGKLFIIIQFVVVATAPRHSTSNPAAPKSCSCWASSRSQTLRYSQGNEPLSSSIPTLPISFSCSIRITINHREIA